MFAHLSKWTRTVVALATVAAGAIALSAPLVPLTACTTEDCEPAYANFSGGDMQDPNTWESNPINSPWQPYTPQLTILLQIPLLAGRSVTGVAAYISPAQLPNKPPTPPDEADNFTPASGNLAEFQLIENHDPVDAGNGVIIPGFLSMSLHNDTCATYFVRIVVTVAEVTTDAADAGDAALSSDASDADIFTDAARDGAN